MNGWVIVYLPGGDVYQIFDPGPVAPTTFSRKVFRRGVKTFLACAQLYYWIKG